MSKQCNEETHRVKEHRMDECIQNQRESQEIDENRNICDSVDDDDYYDDYEEDEYEEEDNPDLPPSTRYYNTGRPAPDGIIYDRFN